MRNEASRSASASSSGSAPSTRGGQALGLGDHVGRAPLATRRRERLGPAAGRRQQAVHLAQPVALGQERGLLVLAWPELLDLVDLEGEQIEIAVARGRSLAQVGQPALDLAHLRVRERQLVAPRQVVAPAEGVEQLELSGGERQAPVLVLAEEGERACRRAPPGRRPWPSARRRRRACGRSRQRAGPAPARRPRRRSAPSGRRARNRRRTPAGPRIRPPRRPRGHRDGRSPRAAFRPAAGRARGRARSCRLRSRR